MTPSALTRPRGFPAPMGKSKCIEDRLLLAHCQQQGGAYVLEVKVGRGGAGAYSTNGSYRAIDAVRFPDQSPSLAFWTPDSEAFDRDVVGCSLDIIEAKRQLDIGAIGQVLAAIEFFARSYPECGSLRPVIVAGPPADPALRWCAHQHGIEVALVALDPAVS